MNLQLSTNIDLNRSTQNSKVIENLIKKSNCYYKLQKYDLMIETLNQAIEFGSLCAMYYLGRYYHHEKKYNLMKKYLLM